MRNTLLFAVFGLSLVLSASDGEAREKLRVGVEAISYLPHYAISSDEDPVYVTSFAKEALDAFAAVRGYEFEYVPMPIKRLIQSFIAGEGDLKYPDNSLWNPELRRYVRIAYSEPLETLYSGAMVLPKNKGRGVDKVKILGTVLGFTPWQWNDAIREYGIRVSQNRLVAGLIEQALRERVDCIDVEYSVANYHLRQMGRPGELVFDETLPWVETNFRLSSIKHPEVIEEFDAFLAASADYIEVLKLKYGIENPEIQIHP